ncbi:MAG TPA: hypothetical protein VFH61_01570, partial [Thermoleophilia bacterium]|nr:hypothetical protein [Thermoleophilia bacterium]
MTMRREREPDDRYHAALRAAQEPAQPFEAALWRLKNQGQGDDVIVRLVDAYEDPFERELLQAWILAGATDEDISTRLGAWGDILTPYRHLCCNVFTFRDRLEMLRWVHRYEGTREGKLLLTRAVHFDGVEALAHLCGLTSNLSPSHVNEQAMRETYFRSMGTMRSTSISSAENQAVHQMIKTAMTAAAASQKSGAPNINEALLKLKHREMTFHVEDVMPHGE